MKIEQPEEENENKRLIITNDKIELEIVDVTIHSSRNRKNTYVRIELSGVAPTTTIFSYATGLFGPGGKILRQCGVTLDDEISGEDGERANIADRCIGKTVIVKLGIEAFDGKILMVVKDVL